KQDVGAAVGRQVEVHVARNGEARRTARDRRRVVHRLAQRAARGQVGRGVEDRGRQTGAALADRQWLGGAQRRFRVVAVAKVLGLKRVAARRQGPRRLGRSPHRLGVKQ